MNLKFLTAMLLLNVTLGTSCMRRTVTQGFGGISSPVLSKSQTRLPPDASLRSVFKQQTQGAFNPLSDDPHVQELQARLKSNPSDIPARLELGSVYESYKLYDSALDQYREALRPLPAVEALAEQAEAGLARSARASHRVAEAIPVLERALIQRASANSWNELGLLYEDIRSLPAAESAFDNAVAANPESDSAHNNLGYGMLLQGRLEQAEAEFRKAVELNPSSATARNNLAVVLTRRDDLQGALEQFLMTADAATAHNNLAVVLLEMGQYERSRQQLVEALTIRHYFAPALANFKLVQERIREQGDAEKFGRLPLNPVRMPSSLVALNPRIDDEELFDPFLERN
jgi:tetratricopeptide (TPR) repeat protein